MVNFRQLGSAVAVRRIASTVLVRHIHIALVVRTGTEVVGQPVADNLPDRRDFFVQNERAGVRRQKQVAVGVHPALKSETGAGEITQVAIGKNTELENRDERHFHAPRHIHRRSTRPGGADFQGQRNDFRSEAGVGSRN